MSRINKLFQQVLLVLVSLGLTLLAFYIVERYQNRKERLALYADLKMSNEWDKEAKERPSSNRTDLSSKGGAKEVSNSKEVQGDKESAGSNEVKKVLPSAPVDEGARQQVDRSSTDEIKQAAKENGPIEPGSQKKKKRQEAQPLLPKRTEGGSPAKEDQKVGEAEKWGEVVEKIREVGDAQVKEFKEEVEELKEEIKERTQVLESKGESKPKHNPSTKKGQMKGDAPQSVAPTMHMDEKRNKKSLSIDIDKESEDKESKKNEKKRQGALPKEVVMPQGDQEPSPQDQPLIVTPEKKIQREEVNVEREEKAPSSMEEEVSVDSSTSEVQLMKQVAPLPAPLSTKNKKLTHQEAIRLAKELTHSIDYIDRWDGKALVGATWLYSIGLGVRGLGAFSSSFLLRYNDLFDTYIASCSGAIMLLALWVGLRSYLYRGAPLPSVVDPIHLNKMKKVVRAIDPAVDPALFIALGIRLAQGYGSRGVWKEEIYWYEYILDVMHYYRLEYYPARNEVLYILALRYEKLGEMAKSDYYRKLAQEANKIDHPKNKTPFLSTYPGSRSLLLTIWLLANHLSAFYLASIFRHLFPDGVPLLRQWVREQKNQQNIVRAALIFSSLLKSFWSLRPFSLPVPKVVASNKDILEIKSQIQNGGSRLLWEVLADAYASNGESFRALCALRKALRDAVKRGDQRMEARINHRLALFYEYEGWNLKEPQLAMKFLDRSFQRMASKIEINEQMMDYSVHAPVIKLKGQRLPAYLKRVKVPHFWQELGLGAVTLLLAVALHGIQWPDDLLKYFLFGSSSFLLATPFVDFLYRYQLEEEESKILLAQKEMDRLKKRAAGEGYASAEAATMLGLYGGKEAIGYLEKGAKLHSATYLARRVFSRKLQQLAYYYYRLSQEKEEGGIEELRTAIGYLHRAATQNDIVQMSGKKVPAGLVRAIAIEENYIPFFSALAFTLLLMIAFGRSLYDLSHARAVSAASFYDRSFAKKLGVFALLTLLGVGGIDLLLRRLVLYKKRKVVEVVMPSKYEFLALKREVDEVLERDYDAVYEREALALLFRGAPYSDVLTMLDRALEIKKKYHKPTSQLLEFRSRIKRDMGDIEGSARDLKASYRRNVV